MSSLAAALKKSAAQVMEEEQFDPVRALIDIARNRNNIADVRVKACVALLPYAHAPVPTTQNLNIREGTGVMKTPGMVTEEEWGQAVTTMARAIASQRTAVPAPQEGDAGATKH